MSETNKPIYKSFYTLLANAVIATHFVAKMGKHGETLCDAHQIYRKHISADTSHQISGNIIGLPSENKRILLVSTHNYGILLKTFPRPSWETQKQIVPLM